MILSRSTYGLTPCFDELVTLRVRSEIECVSRMRKSVKIKSQLVGFGLKNEVIEDVPVVDLEVEFFFIGTLLSYSCLC